MSGHVRRPTEGAAIAAASRSARPKPTIRGLLTAVAACERRGDREGVRRLTAALVARQGSAVAS